MLALLLVAAALGLSNFAAAIGIGISGTDTPTRLRVGIIFAVSAAVIGAVSIAMSLAGLELGARIGTRTGRYSEYLGGTTLILVGAAIAAGLI